MNRLLYLVRSVEMPRIYSNRARGNESIVSLRRTTHRTMKRKLTQCEYRRRQRRRLGTTKIQQVEEVNVALVACL